MTRRTLSYIQVNYNLVPLVRRLTLEVPSLGFHRWLIVSSLAHFSKTPTVKISFQPAAEPNTKEANRVRYYRRQWIRLATAVPIFVYKRNRCQAKVEGGKKSQFLMQKDRESRILVAHFMPVLIINAEAELSSYWESLSTSLPASPQTIKGCPSSQWLSKKTAMRCLKPVFKK